MKFLIFTITQLSIFVFGSLLLWTLLSDRFRIWPPPGKKSWQYHSTLTLIRIVYTGTIGVAILDWNTFVLSHYSRYLLGIPLAIIGFGIAFYGLFYLGLTNSYGLKGGLITTGIYQYSRNPQYTGLMIGIVGFALICNSSLVYILSIFGIVLYSITPFVEESWLHKAYGLNYDEYKRKTPRFIGIGCMKT